MSEELQPEILLPLAQTPLFQLAVELKARLTSFGGWEMPVQFTGIGREHEAVRTAAGMFDISHMGKFVLKAKNLISQLQHLVPSDLNRLQPGVAQYTVLLNLQRELSTTSFFITKARMLVVISKG
jgi:aminomethyltransferase